MPWSSSNAAYLSSQLLVYSIIAPLTGLSNPDCTNLFYLCPSHGHALCVALFLGRMSGCDGSSRLALGPASNVMTELDVRFPHMR